MNRIMQLRQTTSWGLFILAAAGMNACSVGGPLREDQKATAYNVPQLPSSWKALEKKADADKAWSNTKTGAVLSLRSLCERYEHVSLKNLSQNLKTIFMNAEVISSNSRSIASRDAHDTTLRGELDGVSVESRMIVVRKNHCIFDFAVIEHPTLSASSIKGIEKLLSGFDYRGEPDK